MCSLKNVHLIQKTVKVKRTPSNRSSKYVIERYAECPCGWRSKPYETWPEVHREIRTHVS